MESINDKRQLNLRGLKKAQAQIFMLRDRMTKLQAQPPLDRAVLHLIEVRDLLLSFQNWYWDTAHVNTHANVVASDTRCIGIPMVLHIHRNEVVSLAVESYAMCSELRDFAASSVDVAALDLLAKQLSRIHKENDKYLAEFWFSDPPAASKKRRK